MANFRERLVWDPPGRIMDGERRYLFLRCDALMGIFRNLPEPARRQALEAFAASIAHHGGDSAGAYYETEGRNPDALKTVMIESSPLLGWGNWRFFDETADGFKVAVTDSPFVHGFGRADHPVCYPIVGMLTAVSRLVLGGPPLVHDPRVHDPRVHELECAAMGAPQCVFAAERVDQGKR